jgi:phage gp29-like protein
MKIKLFGTEIDLGLLREPQSLSNPRTAELRRDFETHPLRGMTPAKMATLLEDAERGDLRAQADLAEDMEERVPHLHAELGKRKRAPMSLPYRIAPPQDKPSSWEQGYAEELTHRIQHLDIQSWREREVDDKFDAPGITDVFFDMLDALLHGYSCIEMAWRNDGMDWTPELSHRHPNWFTTPQINRNKLMLRTNSGGETVYAGEMSERVAAESLRRWGWITHTHRAKSGYLTRGGLVRIVAWPALYMMYSVQDFAELLRILGIPPMLGTYNRNATDTEKSSLMRAVLNIGHNARGIIPEGMKVDFFQHAQLQGDHFINMIRWAEGSISKAVVGGTLTTDSQGGTKTNALGTMHQDEFWELTKSDVSQLCGTLSRDLVMPFAMLNAKGRIDERRPFRFVIDTNENEDLAQFADSLTKLKDTGFLHSIPVSWAHERTGIPQPKDGEQTLGSLIPQAAPMPAATATAKLAALRAEPAQPDGLDQFADDMTDDWRPVMEPMIAPILKALEDVKTPDELDAALAEAARDMDLQPQAERLFNMMMTAYLAGRATPPT